MNYAVIRIYTWLLLLLLSGCKRHDSGNTEMASLLSTIDKNNTTYRNAFSPEAHLQFYDSLLAVARNGADSMPAYYFLANTYLKLGREEKAIEIGEYLVHKTNLDASEAKIPVLKDLAISYLRLAERQNCITNHSGESCILPIQGKGVHFDKTGAQKAIEIYTHILRADPADLESKWLLNIAYMAKGDYPAGVPKDLLIKGLDDTGGQDIKPFIDASINTGLNTKSMAGGSIVDDFNNDGYLDLITSGWGLKESMHYCSNNGNGSFTDMSSVSGLSTLTGGLNIMQTDYNNDGLKDIFVLRGGWMRQYGKQPNSLLRNNGDGTFTDVTKKAGLVSFHPTQTAAWADFNNDGWLDVFIGNETTSDGDPHPCELFMNNGNGTFSDLSSKAGCDIVDYVKGVTAGDYNNDGWVDLFLSTLSGNKILLKNEGVRNNTLQFTNATTAAGLHLNKVRTFPTWFWDYDNDGWLDILVCGYGFDKSLAAYAAAGALGKPIDEAGYVFLFRNKHNGSFEEVSQKAGLHKIVFAMGSNFGDIDNDGYLDMYFGTGNPFYQSLIPNKMFRNIGGKSFVDITVSARLGNLQKGHGVSFADMDNDGDEDIHISMGGAFIGDAYDNSLYINPGQNKNNWINISLDGTKSNRAAIGSRIKITFRENGITRAVYRTVNSGGSFGSNPLRQHMGVGKAAMIDSIEIIWAGSKATETFKNITVNSIIRIREGKGMEMLPKLKPLDFLSKTSGLLSCSPD